MQNSIQQRNNNSIEQALHKNIIRLPKSNVTENNIFFNWLKDLYRSLIIDKN